MKPASERAYEALKSRILNGSLASGDRLVERELCAELDVSRTPVREALGQLCAEGLAITRPRRGVVVSDIDTSEVSEIFELGVVLEGFAARLCAKKANGETIKKLKLLLMK